MKKIVLTLFLFLSLFYTQGVWAVNVQIESAYNKFLSQIWEKYTSERQDFILESVQDRIGDIINTQLNSKRAWLLKDLDSLNNEEIFQRWLENNLSQEDQILYESQNSWWFGAIPYSELSTQYVAYTTELYPVSNDENYYYGYNFNSFRFYDELYWVSERSIENSWFSRDDTIVFRDDAGRYNFVVDYNKHKLVSTDSVFWLPGNKFKLQQKHL